MGNSAEADDSTAPRRDFKLLVVNPGSTSTKLGIFEKGAFSYREVIRHPAAELAGCGSVIGQLELRQGAAHSWFRERAQSCDAVVATGGLFKPVGGGTFRVNPAMCADATAGVRGAHASNLGCLIAEPIAGEYKCPAFVVDPVSVDELEPLARYSGHPLIERSSLSHALNIHAVARRAAGELRIPHRLSSFVVAHMGGGISVAPVRGGRIIDVNDAASDGPFSPERTGGLPLQDFIGLAVSGQYTGADLRLMVMGAGGLVAYLGTNNAGEVEKRIEAGDVRAAEVYGAMGYQIAKEIGAMATVLGGIVDGIVLTGGLASSEMLVRWISDRVRYLAKVLVYPGEMEMEALAGGALRVLNDEEKDKEY